MAQRVQIKLIDDLDGTRPHGNAGRYAPSPVPPPKGRAG